MTTTDRKLTAFEITDMLTERMVALVIEKNAGRNLTEAQFTATVLHTVEVAFPRFLAELAAADPEKATRFLDVFVAQMAATDSTDRPTR